MIEIISESTHKARIKHKCDYCNCDIKRGEIYWRSFLKDGGYTYEWKEHDNCHLIASELWDFIEPDNGLDSDGFSYGVHEFARVFICPDCPHFDKNAEGCFESSYIPNSSFCMSRIVKCLKENKLKGEYPKGDFPYFHLVKREVIN